MLEIDYITLQSINMAIAEGICIFVFFYILGKFWFMSPKLDSRIEDVRANYKNVEGLNFKPDFNSKFHKRKEKKEGKRFNLKGWFFSFILKNSLGGKETVKSSFEQAGWISKDIQSIFITFKLISFFLGSGGAYVAILTVPALGNYTESFKWLFIILIGFSGWLLPDVYLKRVIKKRMVSIERQFPDALDLIVICLQAGLGLNRAIDRVAREFAAFGKEIAAELMMTSIELEIMLDRRQALQNLQARVPSLIIRSFTSTILQSIQQGTPILQALDVLSKEIRDTRMQSAENKAAKLPSYMVIPLVLFVMPNLFIVLLGPSMVKLMGTN